MSVQLLCLKAIFSGHLGKQFLVCRVGRVSKQNPFADVYFLEAINILSKFFANLDLKQIWQKKGWLVLGPEIWCGFICTLLVSLRAIENQHGLTSLTKVTGIRIDDCEFHYKKVAFKNGQLAVSRYLPSAVGVVHMNVKTNKASQYSSKTCLLITINMFSLQTQTYQSGCFQSNLTVISYAFTISWRQIGPSSKFLLKICQLGCQMAS